MDEDPYIIGERRHYGGHSRPFGVPREDRRQHVYIVGRSGLGKTTLIRNLVIQDIEQGEGSRFSTRTETWPKSS